MAFMLRPFQEEAVAAMSNVIAAWVRAAGDLGRPPADVEGNPIPLFASLTAITGAGKTPILADVVGRIGPAIVIWTSQRAVVVDQTVGKLAENYRQYLPDKLTIIGEKPTKEEWEDLIEGKDGTVIWCLTVASWNAPDEAAKGTGEARLNIHRPAPDWAGGERSPWEQLGDLGTRKRPLWVVYDESQGQTDVQLDQLIGLNPVGIIAASATPRFSGKIEALRQSLINGSPDRFGPVVEAAMIEVPTQKVAAAGLLKAGIDVYDLNTDAESKIVAAVDQLKSLDEIADNEGIELAPRAIYVVEESDRTDGEPRPVTIWRVLTERCGVPPAQIAVATSTKELPKDAQRVTDLSQLKPRHRHLIFNKKFQEGWDDPEAYVLYFDGETKSATRIRQVIGRVIRQPNGKAFEGRADLNTAWLFLSSPDKKFEAIVESIKKHLLDEYGADPETGEANVKVRVRGERPPAVELREGLPDLSLPRLVISATGLDDAHDRIKSAAGRPFVAADLEAPGSATRMAFNLTEPQKAIQIQVIEIGKNIRTNHRDLFRDVVRAKSREAFSFMPESALTGEMFEQSSAIESRAYREVTKLAGDYVSEFESRTSWTQEPDPERSTWSPTTLDLSRPANLGFTNAVHVAYPDAPSWLNKDEKPMALALDAIADGVWMRNPHNASQGGYGIPMPVQVAGSNAFFPDFLWWIDGGCWAIDTTGVQILGPKVRGKLLDLANPRIALATRGRVNENYDTVDKKDGWTLLLPSAAGPRLTYYPNLKSLLEKLRPAKP